MQDLVIALVLITYVITVENTGNQTLTTVALTDALLADLARTTDQTGDKEGRLDQGPRSEEQRRRAEIQQMSQQNDEWTHDRERDAGRREQRLHVGHVDGIDQDGHGTLLAGTHALDARITVFCHRCQA